MTEPAVSRTIFPSFRMVLPFIDDMYIVGSHAVDLGGVRRAANRAPGAWATNRGAVTAGSEGRARGRHRGNEMIGYCLETGWRKLDSL